LSKKILTVIGARPQFVKAASLSRALKNKKYSMIKEVIVHSGQHYDFNMSNSFFDELKMPKPLYNLNVGSGSHGKQTGSILTELENILINEKPDLVLVYGDTNTTLAAALATAKTEIKLAHVEAGLRSFKKGMPEEVNRVVTDALSDLLFCPSELSKLNLLSEGKKSEKIFISGDIMLDSFMYYYNKSKKIEIFKTYDINKKDYVLATIHRAENTDNKKNLEAIVDTLRKLSETIKVLLPIHPRTLKMVEKYKLSLDGINVIEPVSYLTMIAFMANSRTIITDSGGVQKEAYFLKVPCVTVRDETEWPETCEFGWNTLTPIIPHNIFYKNIESAVNFNNTSHKYSHFYGDGNAATKILDTILDVI
jgi:UDP-N-acetylglucosamine 2-epimerase